jgi:acetyl-CoA C-acetyltransferase
VLVVIWSKESESVDPAHADWLGAEPFLLRRVGMTSRAAAGLQASAYIQRYGLDDEAVRAVRNARESAAELAYGVGDGDTTGRLAGQPVAWPLTDLDLPRACDMACAAVLVTAGAVTAGQSPAWIRGIGWVTERYDLGERDLTRFEALEGAARMALGGDGSARGVGAVEVQEISSIAGFAACEALGLAPRGHGGEAVTGREPVVNPSGGNLAVNPGNAAGVLRFLAAAQQVRGRAGAVQLDPPARTAVGAALHGFAGQGAAVVAFTADESEAA